MLFIGGIIKFLLGLFVGKAMNNPAIMASLGGLLANGGLAKILGSLKGAGMGGLVDSWVSKDKNQAISSDQVTNALGDGPLAELAKKLGMPKAKVAEQVAEHLPNMVDKLTPNGKLPSADEVDDHLGRMGWSGG